MLYALAASFLLTVLAGFTTLYYKEKTKTVNAKLEHTTEVNRSLEQSVNSLQSNLIVMSLKLEENNQRFVSIDTEAKKKKDVFDDSDLAAIANRKPALLEALINKGTQKAFTRLQTVTNPTNAHPPHTP